MSEQIWLAPKCSYFVCVMSVPFLSSLSTFTVFNVQTNIDNQEQLHPRSVINYITHYYYFLYVFSTVGSNPPFILLQTFNFGAILLGFNHCILV